MINIQNISFSTDGQNKRVSVSWDEIDAEGRTISTNQRMSRIITDKTLLGYVGNITDIIEDMISE